MAPRCREAKYCPQCRGDLHPERIGDRDRLRCAECRFILYENPASAAAAVVLNERGEILLVRRAIAPFKGDWALPAGYQEIDEDAATAIRREVLEETGIECEVLGHLDHVFIPDDPRKPANVAILLCAPTGGSVQIGEEELDVQWFPLDALPVNIGFGNYERILSRLEDPSRYPESPWEMVRKRLAGPDGRTP